MAEGDGAIGTSAAKREREREREMGGERGVRREPRLAHGAQLVVKHAVARRHRHTGPALGSPPRSPLSARHVRVHENWRELVKALLPAVSYVVRRGCTPHERKIR